MDALKIIEMSINRLENNMMKYTDDLKYIWETKIEPFVNSTDCNIDFNHKFTFDNFHEFMLTQKTYGFMLLAHKRLTEQRQFLRENTIDNR
jgi:hypothetical protein